MRLLSLVKLTFNKEIPIEMLFGSKSISDIAQFIKSGVSSKIPRYVCLLIFQANQSNPASDDLTNFVNYFNTELKPQIQLYQEQNECNVPADQMNQIFLTGVTGFLGIYLLHGWPTMR